MHVGGAERQKFLDIVGSNTPTGHHHRSVSEVIDQYIEEVNPNECRFLLPGRQDPVESEFGDSGVRVDWIGDFVECPMERQLDLWVRRPCRLDELRAPVSVNVVFGVEDPEHNAVEPPFSDRDHIGLHRFELVVVVSEVTTPRPDHHEHGNRQCIVCFLQHSGRGSRATLWSSGAKFDPIRAVLLCNERIGDAETTDF